MSDIRVPGDLLKAARAAAGMTQRELARKAHTAQSVVARVELGETNPTWSTLARLLRAAGFRLSAELERIPRIDALARAEAYGVDVQLLRDGIGISVSERLERLDQNAAFIQELRKATGADRRRRRVSGKIVVKR